MGAVSFLNRNMFANNLNSYSRPKRIQSFICAVSCFVQICAIAQAIGHLSTKYAARGTIRLNKRKQKRFKITVIILLWGHKVTIKSNLVLAHSPFSPDVWVRFIVRQIHLTWQFPVISVLKRPGYSNVTIEANFCNTLFLPSSDYKVVC